MSTKRILGIVIAGMLFIAAIIGVMYLATFPRRDNEIAVLPTPAAATSSEPPDETGSDTLDRVEVTRETVQDVVSTLSRPQAYSREVTVTTYWNGGSAEYQIAVSVANGITSLSTQPPSGAEKRVIVTVDTLYIWYRGDKVPYVGNISSAGGDLNAADEWQMIITYEDLLSLEQNSILDAGYVERGGEDCIYAVYYSPKLGYTRMYYVSIDLGLVVSAEEFDETGALIYEMISGDCDIGDVDIAEFTLPDGTVLAA